MEIFKLFGSIFVNSDAAQESIRRTERGSRTLGQTMGNGIKTAAKWGGALVGAALVVAGAVLQVDEATKEYRENMGKLNTAYEGSGKSTKEAQKAYTEMYKILGDNGQATEAAQLLSNIVENEKDIAEWSDIAAGVVGRFGEALPIQSLIESSNETAKVGKVTGALADALNWAGVSEDEFNEKLAAAGTEQERNKLITETLSGTYAEYTEAYKENNAEIIKSRENQAMLDASMGTLGASVAKIKGKFIDEFTPSVSGAIDALGELLAGSDTASEDLSANITEMVEVGMSKLPEFIGVGLEIIAAIGVGIIKAIPGLLKKIPGMLLEITISFVKASASLYVAGAEMITELWNGMKSIWDSITGWVSEKTSWLMDKIKFWGTSQVEKNNRRIDGSHASGLSRVPFDGYIAELHKDEEILTARESKERKSYDNSDVITAINNLAKSMKTTNVTEQVYVLGETELMRIVHKLTKGGENLNGREQLI